MQRNGRKQKKNSKRSHGSNGPQNSTFYYANRGSIGDGLSIRSNSHNFEQYVQGLMAWMKGLNRRKV